MGLLLERIADGDRNAVTALYKVTSARVYGMALRVLRDPGYAEETVQEVYLQVWRNAGAFDPSKGSAGAWLITLAHRRAIDRVRAEQAAQARDSAYGSADAPEPSDQVAEEILRDDEYKAVVDCLDILTPLQRSSIELAYYRGMTYRQVAERSRVGLPAVKSRMRDGLARLRECLVGQGHD